VHKGQLLVRLDNPESESQLGQLQAETQSLQARSARLTSEGGMGGNVACQGADCAGEEALQAARASALHSKVEASQATAEQARRDAAEAAATISSLQSTLGLAQHQVQMMAPLAAKNIVPQTDLLEKQREVVDIQGRIAAAREQQGKALAGVREAEAQASQATFEFKQQALDERSQVNAKIAVNEQSLRGAEGKFNRTEIRSPVDGVVNDVQVTTIGSYVQPGQKIMEVVPLGDKLLVETRVKPSDIAFIKVGDRALVKVTAYDFSIYGGLDGRVVQVSADSIYDEKEKEAYFTVIVQTDKSYLMSMGHPLPITPGMMTNTQIITGRKSILTYLLKPALKANSDALRER
jgi:adhesin transport system membrane fusion protein